MLTFINRWLKKGLFKSPELGRQLLKIKETLTSPSWSSSLDTKNDRKSKMRCQTKHSFMRRALLARLRPCSYHCWRLDTHASDQFCARTPRFAGDACVSVGDVVCDPGAVARLASVGLQGEGDIRCLLSSWGDAECSETFAEVSSAITVLVYTALPGRALGVCALGQD